MYKPLMPYLSPQPGPTQGAAARRTAGDRHADPHGRCRRRRGRRGQDRRAALVLRGLGGRRLRRGPRRARSSTGWTTRGSRRPGRRVRRRRRRGAGVREHRRDARLQRRRPALRPADLRRRASPLAPTTSTWRCRCRTRTPSGPYERDRRQARRRAVRRRRGVGGGRAARARRHRRRARAVRRLRRATPPTTFARSTSRRARRREPRRVATRQPIFAPSFSIWTTIEECLNPPVIWEKDRGWFTTAAVQRARGRSTSPRASARSSASTSSTRRCCSSRAGSTRGG